MSQQMLIGTSVSMQMGVLWHVVSTIVKIMVIVKMTVSPSSKPVLKIVLVRSVQ